MNGPHLTLKQRAVAACVLDGLGDKQTAAALGCCESAVSKRVKRLREIYGAASRVQLAVAIDRQLLPRPLGTGEA